MTPMNHPHSDADRPSPGFPTVRPRRLRYNPLVRELVRETELSPRDLILPLFVRPGKGVRQEIGSMPGNFQLSVDTLVEEVGAARDLGIKSFILFGIPASKDATGSSALEDDGIVQQALRALAQGLRQRRAAHHRRVLLRVHRPRPLRHPARPTAASSTWTTTPRCRSSPSSA